MLVIEGMLSRQIKCIDICLINRCIFLVENLLFIIDITTHFERTDEGES
jgi:hypothetical protein